MTKNAPVRHFHPFARLTLRPGLVLFLCLVFGFLAAIAVACAGQEATLEERAYALDRQLMCPVCDGQTVDQSNAQVSLDMKGVIREKLRAGESEDEILEYFAARYGDAVLASPPTTGFSVVVWVVPPAALLLSFALPGRNHAAHEETRHRRRIRRCGPGRIPYPGRPRTRSR